MLTFKPLWRTLLDKDMSKTDLRIKASLSTATLAKLSKGEYVSMEVIERICTTLDCKIEDVIEVIKK